MRLECGQWNANTARRCRYSSFVSNALGLLSETDANLLINLDITG